MSRVTRHKHVMKEILADDFELPKENQQIVRVLRSCGNNLHEVEPATNEENFLVSMPTKFRRNIWVKRGNYIVVETIQEGDKVKAEIVKILMPEDIKEYTKEGIWPKKFTNKREVEEDTVEQNHDDLFRNPNRQFYESEDEETSSSEDGETTSSENED